jgi:hypothetical protein
MVERAHNQSLALSYGPEEERAGLESAMVRTALNVRTVSLSSLSACFERANVIRAPISPKLI